MRLPWALGLLAVAGVAGATDRVEVVSTHRDAVSVTIYRDLFALVTETRTIDMPEGPATLVFDDVVETLLPQSAVLTGIDRPLDESNYDFEQLTPSSLLRASIGKTVTLTRTHRGTGKVSEVEARVVAAGSKGVVFETADGSEALRCSGLPERLRFDQLPADLHARPRLSVQVAAGAPGRRTVKLSYLAHGFAWNADYVANSNATGERLDLSGWITLENMTGASFPQAEVQVVAGKLNLLDEDDGGTSAFGATADIPDEYGLNETREETRASMRDELEAHHDELALLDGCFATPLPPSPPSPLALSRTMPTKMEIQSDELEETVVVTGFRASMAVRESLADYQMYRLPTATDLGARQTKQVLFLHQPEVRVRRFYAINLSPGGADDDEPFYPVGVRIAWTNRKSEGLGIPMPGGVVRCFDEFGEGRIFAGEDRVEDRPVGTHTELFIGQAPDVVAEMVDFGASPDNTFDLRMRISNAKLLTAPVEVRQHVEERYQIHPRIRASSARAVRKDDYFLWTIDVPPGSEKSLTYRFQWDDRD